MAQYISKDAVVEASYDSDNKQLVLVFETTDGTETVNVAIDDFVDIQQQVTVLNWENDQFSVKLNEEYLCNKILSIK